MGINSVEYSGKRQQGAESEYSLHRSGTRSKSRELAPLGAPRVSQKLRLEQFKLFNRKMFRVAARTALQAARATRSAQLAHVQQQLPVLTALQVRYFRQDTFSLLSLVMSGTMVEQCLFRL